MIYRGVLEFSDGGEVLLEELRRMKDPSGFIEKIEATGLSWRLTEVEYCDTCFERFLTDENFDPDFDACEACMELFKPSENDDRLCRYCHKALPVGKEVILHNPDHIPERFCSIKCFQFWSMKFLAKAGFIRLKKWGKRQHPGRGCIGWALKKLDSESKA